MLSQIGARGRLLKTGQYFLLCLAVALATHFSGLYQPMHADWSTRVRVARDWRGGAALYRETYCNTQPVVYLWILLIDSARPEVSMYLAEAALAAVAATVFSIALRRELPRAASAAPLLLIAWTGMSTTFYGGQITEAPALWCDVLGLSCFALAVQRGRSWLAALAGVFFFLMVGFRVPAAINGLAWVPLVLYAGKRHGRLTAGTLRVAAMLGVGGSLLALYLHGMWDEYWREFLVVLSRNFRYGAVDRVPLTTSLFEAARTISRILLHNTAAPLLAGVGLWTSCKAYPWMLGRERRWLLVVLLWLAAAVASAFPGGRHYDHYYHLCWAPLSLLSVMWLGRIRRHGLEAHPTWHGLPARGKRLVRSSTLGAVLAAAAIVIAVVFNIQGAAKAMRDLRAGTHPWKAIADAVEYLDRTTRPDEPVLMNLWGDWAELFWRARRPAPSLPIPHVVPSDRYTAWISAVRANPPSTIVTDGTPWQPIDSRAAPGDVRRLQRMIDNEYEEVRRIGPLVFFTRNPSAGNE
jgi:hypothetical protein